MSAAVAAAVRGAVGRRRAIVGALVFGAGLVAASPLFAQAGRGGDRLAAALEDYEQGHWPQAFEGFARLADAGDRDAARIALQMWRHGPALYGRGFDADPARRAAWLAHAACPDDDACARLAARR